MRPRCAPSSSNWRGLRRTGSSLPLDRVTLTGRIRAVTVFACLVVALGGCTGNHSSTPLGNASVPITPTGPCPLVTDADVAKLHPMLKRAGDDWDQKDGSIWCDVSFGANLVTLASAGHIVVPGRPLAEVLKRHSAGHGLLVALQEVSQQSRSLSQAQPKQGELFTCGRSE